MHHTNAVGYALYYVLLTFLILLFIRGVTSWVFLFSRYRPTGGAAAAMEVVYLTTDPVLRPLERLLPPVRIGRSALSLAFPIAFIAVFVLMQVAKGI